MKPILYIYNPVAGHGVNYDELFTAIEKLTQNDYLVTLLPTLEKGFVLQFLSSNEAQQFNIVLCNGGDGTLSEVVAGIYDSNRTIELGYLPSGTTNDFAHTLGLSEDNYFNLERFIKSNKSRLCDIGLMQNKSTFVYTCGFGLFTALSYNTDQSIKNEWGWLAYLLGSANELLNLKDCKTKITYTYNNKKTIIEDNYIIGLVLNTHQVGGIHLPILDSALTSDGVFEALFVKRPKDLSQLSEMTKAVFNGVIPEHLKSDVVYLKFNELDMEFDKKVPFTADGEFAGEYDSLHVSVLKNYLHLKI